MATLRVFYVKWASSAIAEEAGTGDESEDEQRCGTDLDKACSLIQVDLLRWCCSVVRLRCSLIVQHNDTRPPLFRGCVYARTSSAASVSHGLRKEMACPCG